MPGVFTFLGIFLIGLIFSYTCGPNFIVFFILLISETISYQGGLVCQALMKFHGRARKLILDDLFELEREQLKAIFDSAPGSFLLEKMGATIPEKKFIEHIKKLPIDEIAFGRLGSRNKGMTLV